MAGAARLAMLSFSAPDPDGADDDYLRWHLLDHLPEQYSIPQLRLGQRWRATPAQVAARVAAEQPFDRAAHLVGYLFAEPLEGVPERFYELGQELYDAGRLPHRLPKVHVGAFEVTSTVAAADTPARPEVLPFCAYPGIYLVVVRGGSSAEVAADLVGVAGVAGAWSFRGCDPLPSRYDRSEGIEVAMAFLDQPIDATAAAVAEHVRSGGAPTGDVLLAGAFGALRSLPGDAAPA